MSSDVSRKQERKWGRFTVDANLRDEWLADLNRLSTLELRSVCEGHVARVDPLSRNAHINAIIRDDLQPFFHRHWDELQESISRLLTACFCRNDARICFEATREIALKLATPLVDVRDTLFIYVTKLHARKCTHIDEETIIWLETTVAAFKALDKGLLALYKHHNGGGSSEDENQ